MRKLTAAPIFVALLIGGLMSTNLTAAPKAPAAPAKVPSVREIKLTGKLLHYPVSHENTAGNREGMLSVRVDGALIHNVDGFMAQTKEQVAWWAYLEMDEYVGKTDWVTAVYDEDRDKKIGSNIAFYSSNNLKDWTLTSKLPGFYECPELFELPVDGDKNNTRWVVFACDSKYVVGKFDGKTFTPEHAGKHTVHFGRLSASQCFNNPPDRRVVQIGWARIGIGGDMPFNQTFSLPLNLTLRKTRDGIRMFANPIEELNTLHDGTPLALAGKTATKEVPVTLDVDGQLADIRVTIRNGDATKTTLSFGRNAVTYDFVSETLDDVPAPLTDGVLKLRVLVDRPMFEVVVNDGQCYLTAGRQPHALGTVSVKTEGGGVTVESLAVIKMKSIWKK